jgi:hypothetical protein
MDLRTRLQKLKDLQQKKHDKFLQLKSKANKYHATFPFLFGYKFCFPTGE